ncbi:MAG: glycosyltransferase [Bacteroidia bacterium]|nr:glycosyltransferase [Bacteroidia bacterium]
MPKKLLIVSYVFPPTAGIGGRRWAKFAKYLKRKGYDLTILTSENVSKSVSEWVDDVKDLKIETLPFRFPKVISNPGKSIFDKIGYFIWVKILKLVESGNYFDKSIFWRRQVQSKISELIVKQNIECVIVTGGPFRLTHHVASLKKHYPGVKFIVDFRDLWTEDSEITFFSVMSDKRKEVEKKIEKETVIFADKVITTMDSITNYFSLLSSSEKCITISNGYDPDDFENIGDIEETADGKIKFVYAGTLYINLQYIIQPLFEAIGKLKKNNPILYSKIQIHFIGKFPNEYRNFISEYDIADVIKISDFLPLKQVLKKIKSANYCMLMLNDVYSFNLSTKFFEYIALKKKVIVISNKGSASEFIVNNKLGYWIDPVNAYSDLTRLLSESLNGNAQKWDSTFDIENFSLNSLTHKLIEVIEDKSN